jgi:hypothetical protein
MQLDQRDADPFFPTHGTFVIRFLRRGSHVLGTWIGGGPSVSALPKYVGAWAVLCRCMLALRILEVEVVHHLVPRR